MLALLLAATFLTPGNHSVGYRAEAVRDVHRGGRTVWVQAWYPAAVSKAAPMAYGDYFKGVPEPLRQRSVSVHEWAARTYHGNTGKLFASATNTHRNATPATGSFPLIVYGGGAGNSIDENAVLGEYLASNGFVFVAVPATGQSAADITLDAAGLETEARDMELAAEWGKRLPSVARKGWIAGGFSFGGQAATVIAGRQPDVTAVFLLDSSTTMKAFAPLVVSAPSFKPDRLTAPILDLHLAGENVTYDVLDRFIYSQRVSYDIEGPRHVDFNAFPLLYAPDTKRAEVYEWIARTVLSFAEGKRMFRGTNAYRTRARRRDALRNQLEGMETR